MKRRTCLSIAAILVFVAAFLGMRVSRLHAQGESAGQQAYAEPQSGQTSPQERPTKESPSASAGVSAATSEPQKAEKATAEARPADEIVVKTYSLKYIGWRDLVEATRLYLQQWTGSDNTLTVEIRKSNIPDFEAALKKLDVEKKNIMFRVFTIIASRDNPPAIYKTPETTEIANRELKGVLDELKGLWNFKHYWIDAPSLLTLRDGSDANSFKLVSDRFDFRMILRGVRLVGELPGNRMITVGQIGLEQRFNGPKGPDNAGLIDTKEVSLKEKGYLVVGVSGLENAPDGLALILVISAEIK